MVSYTVSVNGGAAATTTTAPTSVTLGTTAAPDGLYTISITVKDDAGTGNVTTVTKTVRLDRTAAAITASLSAPNNTTYYDVGAPITVTWSATDANGLGTSSASIEGQTISASGGTINVNALLVGLHTVTITQFDAAGNMSTKALTFTIRATPSGILAAINAALASAMTAAEKSTLVSAITAIINAPGNSGKQKMKTFISTVQSATTAQMTLAFQTLLLNWSNDAYSRM